MKKANTANWRLLKEYLARGGTITKDDCKTLIERTCKVLKTEPNLIQINDPIVVVGDIHGQYYDLLKILEVGGNFEKTRYFFTIFLAMFS